MKTLRYFLLPGWLLATSCHHQASDPAPTKTALLTAHTWQNVSQALIINGYAGTRTAPTATSYTFNTDGQLLARPPGKASEPAGTWQLTSNDTQLLLKPKGGGVVTYQLFDLGASSLSFGYDFDAATIQQQVAAGGSQPVPALLLSAGNYTFPTNTPTFQPSQVTSLQLKYNLSAD